MNTIFKVKNKRFMFLDVGSLHQIDSWIFESLECNDFEKVNEEVLDRDIVLLYKTICPYRHIIYRLNFPNLQRQVNSDFLLVSKKGNCYCPLSEEQENFIVDHLDLKIINEKTVQVQVQ